MSLITNIDEIDLDDPTELDSIAKEPDLWERPVIRMSHSSRSLLHGCERKYYLSRYKKMDTVADIAPADDRDNNTHLDYGHALGVGAQTLLITQDLEAAIWAALREFHFAEETPTKNALGLVAALQAFHAQWPYHEWEVATWNNHPAAELSFKIILDRERGDYTCGFMDLVMRHKASGLYTVVEVKSTGTKLEDVAPLYANSDQGVGYSVVLDSIAGEHSTFHVLYIVLQLKHNNILPKWHFLPFLKTKKDRLEFLLAQQLDYEYLKQLEQLDFWPMRGNHCLTFNRTCHLYGVCNLETLRELPYQPPRPEAEWDFTYSIEELIAKQLT